MAGFPQVHAGSGAGKEGVSSALQNVGKTGPAAECKELRLRA